MKKLILIIAIFCAFNCSTSDTSDDYNSTSTGSGSGSSGSGCGTYNGHTLHLGPQGGCYYINSSGNKTYVDRSECQC